MSFGKKWLFASPFKNTVITTDASWTLPKKRRWLCKATVKLCVTMLECYY